MTHITDHVDQALDRLITQYRPPITHSLVDPLTLNPTAGFATHRFPSAADAPIIKVRRIVAGDEVDVWDFQQNTSNYKLSSGGSWLDGSSETFYVRAWYDQTGNGNHVERSTESEQPGLSLNAHNGWPVLDYDGVDDWLRNIVAKSMVDYITASTAVLISYNDFNGAPESHNTEYQLPGIIGELNGYLSIIRGISPVGGNDQIRFYNWDGTADYVRVNYSDNTWYVLGWDHQGNVLTGYVDGESIGDTPSGDTTVILSGTSLTLGRTFGLLRSRARQEIALTFASALTSKNHSEISDYCKGH